MGAAHQPRQGDDQGRRRRVLDAARSDEREARLRVVLHVLYVIFNEGYTATSGPSLQRRDLADGGDPADAPRAPAAARRRRGRRAARADAPDRVPSGRAHGTRRRADPAGRAGPLALARRPDPRGHGADRRHAPARHARPLPAPGGDRGRPRRGAVAPRRPTGRRCSPCTSSSSAWRRTRWSRSTAPSRSRWSTARRAGLDLLATLDDDERLAGHHRLASVRAHLLELAGDTPPLARTSSWPHGRRRARPSSVISSGARRAHPAGKAARATACYRDATVK